jgi:hypothetical protein
MLFAALNEIDGTVIGRNMQRHRHQEFIRFLNAIEEVPAGKAMHVILDTYAAHNYSQRATKARSTPTLHPTSRQHRVRGSTPSKASSQNKRRWRRGGLRLGCRPVNCYQSLRRRTQY